MLQGQHPQHSFFLINPTLGMWEVQMETHTGWVADKFNYRACKDLKGLMQKKSR